MARMITGKSSLDSIKDRLQEFRNGTPDLRNAIDLLLDCEKCLTALRRPSQHFDGVNTPINNQSFLQELHLCLVHLAELCIADQQSASLSLVFALFVRFLNSCVDASQDTQAVQAVADAILKLLLPALTLQADVISTPVFYFAPLCILLLKACGAGYKIQANLNTDLYNFCVFADVLSLSKNDVEYCRNALSRELADRLMQFDEACNGLLACKAITNKNDFANYQAAARVFKLHNSEAFLRAVLLANRDNIVLNLLGSEDCTLVNALLNQLNILVQQDDTILFSELAAALCHYEINDNLTRAEAIPQIISILSKAVDVPKLRQTLNENLIYLQCFLLSKSDCRQSCLVALENAIRAKKCFDTNELLNAALRFAYGKDAVAPRLAVAWLRFVLTNYGLSQDVLERFIDVLSAGQLDSASVEQILFSPHPKATPEQRQQLQVALATAAKLDSVECLVGLTEARNLFKIASFEPSALVGYFGTLAGQLVNLVSSVKSNQSSISDAYSLFEATCLCLHDTLQYLLINKQLANVFQLKVLETLVVCACFFAHAIGRLPNGVRTLLWLIAFRSGYRIVGARGHLTFCRCFFEKFVTIASIVRFEVCTRPYGIKLDSFSEETLNDFSRLESSALKLTWHWASLNTSERVLWLQNEKVRLATLESAPRLRLFPEEIRLLQSVYRPYLWSQDCNILFTTYEREILQTAADRLLQNALNARDTTDLTIDEAFWHAAFSRFLGTSTFVESEPLTAAKLVLFITECAVQFPQCNAWLPGSIYAIVDAILLRLFHQVSLTADQDLLLDCALRFLRLVTTSHDVSIELPSEIIRVILSEAQRFAADNLSRDARKMHIGCLQVLMLQAKALTGQNSCSDDIALVYVNTVAHCVGCLDSDNACETQKACLETIIQAALLFQKLRLPKWPYKFLLYSKDTPVLRPLGWLKHLLDDIETSVELKRLALAFCLIVATEDDCGPNMLQSNMGKGTADVVEYLLQLSVGDSADIICRITTVHVVRLMLRFEAGTVLTLTETFAVLQRLDVFHFFIQMLSEAVCPEFFCAVLNFTGTVLDVFGENASDIVSLPRIINAALKYASGLEADDSLNLIVSNLMPLVKWIVDLQLAVPEKFDVLFSIASLYIRCLNSLPSGHSANGFFYYFCLLLTKFIKDDRRIIDLLADVLPKLEKFVFQCILTPDTRLGSLQFVAVFAESLQRSEYERPTVFDLAFTDWTTKIVDILAGVPVPEKPVYLAALKALAAICSVAEVVKAALAKSVTFCADVATKRINQTLLVHFTVEPVGRKLSATQKIVVEEWKLWLKLFNNWTHQSLVGKEAVLTCDVLKSHLQFLPAWKLDFSLSCISVSSIATLTCEFAAAQKAVARKSEAGKSLLSHVLTFLYDSVKLWTDDSELVDTAFALLQNLSPSVECRQIIVKHAAFRQWLVQFSAISPASAVSTPNLREYLSLLSLLSFYPDGVAALLNLDDLTVHLSRWLRRRVNDQAVLICLANLARVNSAKLNITEDENLINQLASLSTNDDAEAAELARLGLQVLTQNNRKVKAKLERMNIVM